jgi:hypothetical protein
MTAVVRPRRSIYKGKSYGINAKYIVEVKVESGREEVIPIYPNDYQTQKFRRFMLTRESLRSKESLEAHLYEQVGKGLLGCTEITVHDMGPWLTEIYQSESRKTIKARRYSWFTYKIVGPVLTKLSDWNLARQNTARARNKNIASKAPSATRETRAPED